jgi:enamine deaminase RidA (YjgF/YER057c/UK114 family)
MDRERYSSGAEWEDIAGYSRAIKVGKTIEVSGTTSVRDGVVIGKKDLYIQSKTILAIIEDAIVNLGGSIEDVVRTRMYVTDISQWEHAARAHGEVFAKIKPATSMVEVSALIDPDMMIEIEATAIIDAN